MLTTAQGSNLLSEPTTPDAIHAATALQASRALFVTKDTDFRRVEGLPIAVLDDLADAGQF
ncbi:MAG: type II toxin-antitoxin system VapC family toxin [Gemmatimonadetes bacterium]|nr:type II toxin-antitoxin system VapC family toxin [Dehalococcoidia bacterium]MYA11034.1 type II toxin-antitoxin system VapC family toxin [Gemmatimonadota bacterium]MYD29571.1 type II toxin-antitoxin system VapC family toxin [Dehalococcoidia bacterium]MYE60852.1 type II toxin-antitoxin system VapC family toxin [Candidatus Dadabacteria bacterium]MYJ68911.1 type II toxin-antitoxin system VapC family toxin [Gemmatimonadota bacterium]